MYRASNSLWRDQLGREGLWRIMKTPITRHGEGRNRNSHATPDVRNDYHETNSR
jgi:hypothetical protein